MIVTNCCQIFHLVLSTGLPPGRSLPEWSHMQSTILIHVKPLAQTEFHPLSLKMCSPELSPVLAKLYNKCLAKSCFPSCWKSFKNDGDRSDPGKYRPISLLSIVSKIFESFINDSLIKHLDSTGLFSDLQYGFSYFMVHC